MRYFEHALSQRTYACPSGPASLSIPLLPLTAQGLRCVRAPLPAQPGPLLPRGVQPQHMTYSMKSKLLRVLLEGFLQISPNSSSSDFFCSMYFFK